MNAEQVVFTLENLQTLLQEANNVIQELKEYLEDEVNGKEGGDYIG